ncbi:hypothetical protein CRG98_002395, partial [Punica granatum]
KDLLHQKGVHRRRRRFEISAGGGGRSGVQRPETIGEETRVCRRQADHIGEWACSVMMKWESPKALKAHLMVSPIARSRPEWNGTFITLIPKTQNASTFKDFHPIGLYNVSYKAISKIIAERLKPFLHKLISPNQMALLKIRVE